MQYTKEMRYEEPPKLSRLEVETLLSSSLVEDITSVLISTSLYEEDYSYLIKILLSVNLDNEDIARAFLIATSHTARRFKKIDIKIKTTVEEMSQRSDFNLKDYAQDIADEILLFTSS